MHYLSKLVRRLPTSPYALPWLVFVSMLACADAGDPTESSVQSASVVELRMLPQNPEVQVGDSLDFVAFGITAVGDTVSLDVTWFAAGGEVKGSGKGRGRYKAQQEGRNKVKVTHDNLSDSTVVTVGPVPVASVVVTPAAESMAVGSTLRLTATTMDAAGNVLGGRQVSWSSSDDAVASVDGSALVTGVAVGSATITATSEGTSAAGSVAVLDNMAYQTPNILNNASFENGWDGFTGAGTNPPAPSTRATEHAYVGTYGIKRVLPATSGSDIGGYTDYHLPFGVDRLWTRFYFYLDTAINGTLKFHQLYDGGYDTQFSGLYLHDGMLGCYFTPETQTMWMNIARLSELVGSWHSLEMDYWRNGDPSGYPSVALWLDDVAVTSFVSGNPPAPFSWSSGRLNFGTRRSSIKIANAHWLGVLNGNPANTIAGNVWLDRISISTRGRIGP